MNAERSTLRDAKMNKKVLGIIPLVIALCAIVSVFLYGSALILPQQPQQELDFTVSGTNDCLRFLNSTVQTVYIPFRTAANEQWQLTINSTKMPGGANGWTDVYIYNGYWDSGSNHTCMSEDVYPILSEIKSADAQIKGNTAYTQTFGGSTPECYTIFFIFPPGGQATFHITLKQA